MTNDGHTMTLTEARAILGETPADILLPLRAMGDYSERLRNVEEAERCYRQALAAGATQLQIDAAWVEAIDLL